MPEIRYPFKNFRYKVEFNGTEAAGFSEVSGADISVDVIEYREGNEVRTTPRKLAGLTKYGNITLKWGVVGSLEMMEWPVFPAIRFGTFGEYFRIAESVREALPVVAG